MPLKYDVGTYMIVSDAFGYQKLEKNLFTTLWRGREEDWLGASRAWLVPGCARVPVVIRSGAIVIHPPGAPCPPLGFIIFLNL